MLNRLARKRITLIVRKKPVVLKGVALEIKTKLVEGLEQCRQERAAYAATQTRNPTASDEDWAKYLSGELYNNPV